MLRGWPHTKILFRKNWEKSRNSGSEKHAWPWLKCSLFNSGVTWWANLSEMGLFGRVVDCSVDVHQLGQKREWFFCHITHLKTCGLLHGIWVCILPSIAIKNKCNNNPLYHTTSHLIHLKALKWMRSNWKLHLWTWMSKYQRNQPFSFFLSLIFWRKSCRVGGRFCSSEGKTLEGLFLPFVVARVALLTVVQIFSMTSIYVWVQCSIKLGIVLLHSF